MEKQTTTHKHAAAPLAWMAGGLIAALLLVGLMAWAGKSWGWFRASSSTGERPSNQGLDLGLGGSSRTVERLQPVGSNSSSSTTSTGGGSGGSGGSGGDNGGGGTTNNTTNEGDFLSPNVDVDLQDLYESLVNGLSLEQVLALADGLTPSCSSLEIPLVGAQEVCTFRQDNQTIITTFLNDELIATVKLGF